MMTTAAATTLRTAIVHTVDRRQRRTDHGVTDHPVHHDSATDHNGVHAGNVTGSHQHGHEDEHKCPPDGEEGVRYAVAKFDFGHVQYPFIVAIWVLFITYAKIAFHSCEALEKRFPESCLLIVVGVILGIITFFASNSHEIIQFDTQLFFTVILPPIIMEAAYFMPTRAFFDQLGTILLHAILATLSNTLLIGLTLWGIGQAGVFGDSVCLPLLHALVFASLLAAVDPVAVLAIFEAIHVNQMLYIIVFGESLLNDGVAVVLYHMFSELSEIGEENIIPLDVVLGVISFFVVVIGSLGIGTLLGLAGAFSARFTHEMRIMEPMIVIVIPYLAFLVAEMFHMSGIIACTACGMSMRKYVEINISAKSKITIKYALKMLASVAEAIIFMFLGLSVVSRSHVWNTEFVILTVFFCLVYRALVVVVLNNLANLVRVVKLDAISQFVMAYGGLRGAIAFSLAVVLEEHVFPSRQLFITTTIVVVYFTNLVLGTTMQPIVKILRVKIQQKIEMTMSLTIGERVLDHVMVGVEAIAEERGHHHIRERFLKVDYYLRPYITGRERPDKIHRPGAQILKVYHQLTEQDALALTKMPKNTEALMRWNASLRNIASLVRNHTCGDIRREYSVQSLEATEAAAKAENAEERDEGIEEINEEPTSPTSVYSLSLAPLSPEVLSNIASGQQQPESPPGITQSRSHTNTAETPTESDQAPILRRSGSTRSLPGSAAKQHPQTVNPKTPDAASDVKAHARHLKAGRPDNKEGGSMREKGGARRRFRPGWMQSTADGGIDNPALTLEPVATFSVGDPDEVDPSVTITVTDHDSKEDNKEDSSMV